MKTATEVLNDSFKRRKDENISAAGRLMITLEAMEVYASQFQPKWIKIESEEDLPKKDGYYLVYTDHGEGGEPHVYPAQFRDENFEYWDLGISVDNATHWMSLPEPPKTI